MDIQKIPEETIEEAMRMMEKALNDSGISKERWHLIAPAIGVLLVRTILVLDGIKRLEEEIKQWHGESTSTSDQDCTTR